MDVKVLVTPRSFGNSNIEPLKMLQDKGMEVVLNPHGRILTKEEMMILISDVDGVIIGVDPLDKEILKHAKRLKVISKYGVGTDNIDLQSAKEMGISVEVTLGANKEAVADYTFALMLAAARKVTVIDKACRALDWRKMTTVDVFNQTLGLIGLGSIGKRVVERAKGFRMNVLAYDLYRDEAFASANGVKYVSLQTVLKESDFIRLHLPLTENTRHIVGSGEFAMMKRTAVLVNTARGGLIDEDALCAALREKRIWGAGIDVFEKEPPDNKELLQMDDLIMGSHCAASTSGAIKNMGFMASENLISFFDQGCRP